MDFNNQQHAEDHDWLRAKIEWIQVSILTLLHLIKAGSQYKESWRPEFGKFANYMGHKEFITCEEVFFGSYEIIESLNEKGSLDQSSITDYVTPLRRLSSPSYEAPEDVEEILSDLVILYSYWETCRLTNTFFAKSFKGVSEAGLNLALVKLSKNIGRWELSAMFYSDRILSRTIKSTMGHKKRMKKETQSVREIF